MVLSHWHDDISVLSAWVCEGLTHYRRPALHNLQEFLGEIAGYEGHYDLRFVRRGVYCCSAVALFHHSATVALLGRFLPRLGPFAIASGPFSYSPRPALSRRGGSAAYSAAAAR